MLADLKAAPAKTVVVARLLPQPDRRIPRSSSGSRSPTSSSRTSLVPFLDIAYQGFGDGLQEDAAVVRMFAEQDLTMFISSSFSQVLRCMANASAP